MTTNVARTKKHWAALERDGGARVTVILKPEDLKALDSLRETGEGRASALRRLALGPRYSVRTGPTIDYATR